MPHPNVLSYSLLADAISELKDEDEVHCTRLVAQTVQQLKGLHDDDQINWFYQAPNSTGDDRWDALIAGVAVHTWSLSGRPGVPVWTKPLKPLDEWWEPGHMPERWRFWNMVHTPVSLRERKVIFPRMWLDAV